MNVPIFFTKVLKQLKSNSPEILTALGVSGVITTAYLTHQAATKASHHFAEGPPLEQISIKERVKDVWKFYIPAGVSGVFTIGCIIGAQRATGRRTAAAVTAYSLTERAFSEYREKVEEEVGKRKEERLRDEIAQNSVSNTSAGPREIVLTGKGDVLCCELFTKRYFRSDMETLRRAQNDINVWVVNTRSATLEDFYNLIGLSSTSVSSNLGWEDDRLMELIFSTTMAENNEPCLAFDYNYTKPLK